LPGPPIRPAGEVWLAPAGTARAGPPDPVVPDGRLGLHRACSRSARLSGLPGPVVRWPVAAVCILAGPAPSVGAAEAAGTAAAGGIRA